MKTHDYIILFCILLQISTKISNFSRADGPGSMLVATKVATPMWLLVGICILYDSSRSCPQRTLHEIIIRQHKHEHWQGASTRPPRPTLTTSHPINNQQHDIIFSTLINPSPSALSYLLFYASLQAALRCPLCSVLLCSALPCPALLFFTLLY